MTLHALLRPNVKRAVEGLEGHVDKVKRDDSKWRDYLIWGGGAARFTCDEDEIPHNRIYEAAELGCKVCLSE